MQFSLWSRGAGTQTSETELKACESEATKAREGLSEAASKVASALKACESLQRDLDAKATEIKELNRNSKSLVR